VVDFSIGVNGGRTGGCYPGIAVSFQLQQSGPDGHADQCACSSAVALARSLRLVGFRDRRAADLCVVTLGRVLSQSLR
jgi:hypothetical protein